MKISAMQEYGLRCIMQLATHKSPAPLTVREIAQKEALTPVYVAKILVALRRAGLVTSIRGVKGGYALSRPAQDISAGQVLESLGQVDVGKDLCSRFTGTAFRCTHIGNCGIRPVWAELSAQIYGFLNQLNILQLTKDEKEVAHDISQITRSLPASGAPGKTPIRL
jgi:Rrf2 family iron-sulfur cluster assembly transcriptional regulator